MQEIHKVVEYLALCRCNGLLYGMTTRENEDECEGLDDDVKKSDADTLLQKVMDDNLISSLGERDRAS